MNEDEYKRQHIEFIEKELPDWARIIGSVYATKVFHQYFNNHFDRFRQIFNIIGDYEPKNIADLGSYFPYVSLYYNLKFNSSIDLFDNIFSILPELKPYKIRNIELHNFDLVKDSFDGKKYDLVILSEVLEHLPGNLLEWEKKVVDIMEDNGYLVVTYPCGGTNAKDYDKDVPLSAGRASDGHIREYNENTWGIHFRDLKLIKWWPFAYWAYGPTIVALYQKRVNAAQKFFRNHDISKAEE